MEKFGEPNLRQQALMYANKFDEPAEIIIRRAEAYLAFLTGTTAAPAASPTKPSPTTNTSAAAGAAGSAGGTGSDASGTSTAGGQPNGGAEGNGGAAAADAVSSTATGSVPDAFDGDVAKLQAKCSALAARDGAAGLLAQFQKVGAGKWSEVPTEKYPELYANLVAAGV